MVYKIKVEYQTGDSFNSYDEEEILDITWNDADIAKENLRRIQEHYNWAEVLYTSNSIDRPKWLENTGCSEYNIPLLLDDGTIQRVAVSWVGYFETLYGASIISDPDDGWSFKI